MQTLSINTKKSFTENQSQRHQSGINKVVVSVSVICCS